MLKEPTRNNGTDFEAVVMRSGDVQSGNRLDSPRHQRVAWAAGLETSGDGKQPWFIQQMHKKQIRHRELDCNLVRTSDYCQLNNAWRHTCRLIQTA